ncbi:multicomponent Na+:H+ antiporter subunit C [Dietzia sp. 2505]|uniref:sodium:proton antiporter n=1 Tax=Dietzia TaxID=37914 RepID=UPI0015FDDD39|nr:MULTISPECIES: cation:proton antiporter subunit C [Dietzia]MBB1034039.1 cation:proton antiporter subunit C [Dietzia sp. CQ4]MBB1037721.1 cation:proton antiporter subunit C [Dietzia natronolimnaea]
MTLAISVGVLMAGFVFLVLQRGMVRVILGFILLSHAAHLTLMAAGGASRREEPLVSDPDPSLTADGLPQAFVLTAIVIAFAITIYLLVLAVIGGDDDDTDVGDLDHLDLLPEIPGGAHPEDPEPDEPTNHDAEGVHR